MIQKILNTNKIIIFVISILFSSCDRGGNFNVFVLDAELSIRDYIIENNDKYSYFFQIMQKSGFSALLNAHNPYGNNYTLFLPTDSAFESFIENSSKYDTFDNLLSDTSYIKILVLFHVVNTQFTTNDFSRTLLNDSTISGDYHTVQSGVAQNDIDLQYKINNSATIIEPNIELLNGIIHIVDRVLNPAIYTSYEWLKSNNEFSIFTELIEKTELTKKLGAYRLNANGKSIKNRFSLFVEPDSVYAKRGIQSFNDLVDRYGDDSSPITDENNNLYRFAAYHFIENSYFLDQIEDGTINSFTIFPIKFNVDLDIQINKGFKNIETGIFGPDTSYIDYVPVIYDLSNIATLNGPIHIISEILELYDPPLSSVTYDFYNESAIYSLRLSPGRYLFDKSELMENIKWGGAKDGLWYIKSSSPSEEAKNKDFIQIDGNFWLSYKVPRVRPGEYRIGIDFGVNNSSYPIIQVFLDGERLGHPVNLTSYLRELNRYPAYERFWFGPVVFEDFTEHTFRIEAVVPGVLKWDLVYFYPTERL